MNAGISRLGIACAALLGFGLWLGSGYAPAGPGTPEERRSLFQDLVRKTLAWQASSPVKDRTLGLDFARDARALEAEFLAADTNEKLFRALAKLSNVRRDRHLSVQRVEGGIPVEDETQEAPIQFLPDYGDGAATTYFVAALAADFDRHSAIRPTPGDRLVSVHGIPIAEYRKRMDPYLRYSTRARGDWEFADAVSIHDTIFGPELGPGQQVTFGLERSDGTHYDVTLPYLEPQILSWPSGAPRRYPGFRQVHETTCYALYEPEDGRPVVLIDWRQFDMVLIRSDLDSLMAWAERHGRLGHDVIVDATHSEGGAYADLLVRVLADRPFRRIHCSLRISELRERLTRKAIRHYGDPSPQVEWYRNDVARAAAAGLEYAPPVPLRLHGSRDGMAEPAPVHFSGRLVCLLALPGGSSLDQFAALIIDNQLGHTIGMPTAGYSNAWEWDEVARFPTGRPVVRYMWSVGYSIRPNGEVLEGNPAVPDEVVPLTRGNHAAYYDLLLERALAYLDRLRSSG